MEYISVSKGPISSNFALPQVPPCGTAIVPLLNVDDIFQAELAIIKNTSSGDNLCLSQYSLPSLNDGRPIETLASEAQRSILMSLIEQASRRVNIYAIADNSVSAPPEEERPHNQSTIEYLHKKGLYVLPYPKDFVAINHTKFLGNKNYVVITSANMSKHQSDAPYDNTGFLLAGAAVPNGIRQAFLPQWNFSAEKDLQGWARQYPRLDFTQLSLPDGAVKWLNTAPKEESHSNQDRVEIKAVYEDLIWKAGNRESGHTLFFEHFDLSNIGITFQVIHAKRDNPGLDIRFILDPNQYLQGLAEGPHDVRVIAYNLLTGAGVPVRFALVNPHPPTSDSRQIFHDKWAVLNEDEVINGSANLSASSLNAAVKSMSLSPHHHNREVDVWIKDNAVAKLFKTKFLQDWETRATVDAHKAAINQYAS